MDFYRIKMQLVKGNLEVFPDWKVGRSKDLMVRGKGFYAIWDEKAGLWSTDEYDVQRLVDEDLSAYSKSVETDKPLKVCYLSDFSSSSWLRFLNYVSHLSDSSVQLDEKLTFANSEVKKSDFVSRRLPYPLSAGDISAYDELIRTLYDPDERAKLEWSVGSIVAGDSPTIQKFVVLYGSAGTGKSTFLNIIQKLFQGYYAVFEAKALTGANNSFATEAFRSNPLVAIQHDGDLSKIEDNTKLNSIISHEDMLINEKFKASYLSRINAFLFMGTNKPVKITDGKSGIIRRLIDVQPSGNRVSPRRYQTLMSQIEFELGAIANHCLEVYRSMGKDYYTSYRPTEMMLQTDHFFNFIESQFDYFSFEDGVTLQNAYTLYKQFCEETGVEYKMSRMKLREELKNYFHDFHDRHSLGDGTTVRSWYSGFQTEQFRPHIPDVAVSSIVLDQTVSILDDICSDQPAQYASERETPVKRWAEVDTTLRDLDTSKLHYVKLPENHIVIDFDLKGDDGQKSAERNLMEASKWPPTYVEFSKGGAGLHLHYIYSGDTSELSRIFSEGIEIKVFVGDSSLRRRLTLCNNVPIATLSGGLPLKEKKMISSDQIQSEKALRNLVERNLRKEIHAGTKPSVDFIHKILSDAYKSDLQYDLTDMRGKILAFANNSSNQALYCIRLVQDMKFASEPVENTETVPRFDTDTLVFFDIEIFPNLCVVSYMRDTDDEVVSLVNPGPKEIEGLMGMKLVGFNCRKYDNHILYAIYMGYNPQQLYGLSQKIISGDRSAFFGEAYNVSYTDIYDFSSKKQSLKKFQIELGIHHQELGLPWDDPVSDDQIEKVVEYCENDVRSTKAVFHARAADFTARQVLADLSGLNVNQTTQQHTARIIFGTNRKPQSEFVYTDLSETFKGYKFELGKSSYRDVDVVGEGGYVYAEPGMYTDVAVLDVASMHPTSIIILDLFGPYTKNFSDLVSARIAIKHKDYEAARRMLNGRLARYLDNEGQAEELSYALKIVINIVYGLTSAKFENPFRDIRNVDNIVAKRGALFMIDLRHEVEARGFSAIHIKTDSIKIPNASQEIIDFVMDFGAQYGYTFEHEATYSKMCLVNDAVYIAKVGWAAKASRIGKWEAVGAQFQKSYVFKTLFSKEPIQFEDLCEPREVAKGSIYIDYDADKPGFMAGPNPTFVGKVGLFCPIKPYNGGGVLFRKTPDGKFYAVAGTKGYLWMESEMVKSLGREESIDQGYFDSLVDDAVSKISQFGDFEQFVD